MFGGKKSEITAAAFDNEGFEQKWDYKAVSYLGIDNFNKGISEHAREGWELINGCMAGTAHYGYLRRPVRDQIGLDVG